MSFDAAVIYYAAVIMNDAIIDAAVNYRMQKYIIYLRLPFPFFTSFTGAACPVFLTC